MNAFCRMVVVAASLMTATVAVSQEFSEAEKHVFLDEHLNNIRHSGTLEYRLLQQSADKKEFTFEDKAKVNIKEISKGGKSVKVDFLSGVHKFELPDVGDAKGNPIVLYFLEMDVRDMHRLVGGQEAYFRKRIRLALVDKALVRPVMINYNGKSLPASEVRITPYIDDALKDRFGKFYTKSYTFTTSPEVPGGVYEIRTQVDNPSTSAPDAPPLMKTVLSLKSSSN